MTSPRPGMSGELRRGRPYGLRYRIEGDSVVIACLHYRQSPSHALRRSMRKVELVITGCKGIADFRCSALARMPPLVAKEPNWRYGPVVVLLQVVRSPMRSACRGSDRSYRFADRLGMTRPGWWLLHLTDLPIHLRQKAERVEIEELDAFQTEALDRYNRWMIRSDAIRALRQSRHRLFTVLSSTQLRPWWPAATACKRSSATRLPR